MFYISCSFTLVIGAVAAWEKKWGVGAAWEKNEDPEPEPREKKRGAGAGKKLAGSPALINGTLMWAIGM